MSVPKPVPCSPRMIIMSDGTTRYIVDDQLHRDDGPALITPDGREEWYQRGVLHRDGGPALIDPEDNTKQWYQNGLLHRTDGPAMTDSSSQLYYQNGELHRTDGPAEIYDGHEGYWLNGRKWEQGPLMMEALKRSEALFLEAMNTGLPLQKELRARPHVLRHKKGPVP